MLIEWTFPGSGCLGGGETRQDLEKWELARTRASLESKRLEMFDGRKAHRERKSKRGKEIK